MLLWVTERVTVDYIFITLTGLFGVSFQLSDLPVQVGVPGPQLQAVKWFDMEVRTFDLWIIGKESGDSQIAWKLYRKIYNTKVKVNNN